MRWLRQFGGFWYDFVVGDDWRVALTIVLALGVSMSVTHLGHPSGWWILVLAVVVALPVSIHRATRDKG